MGFHTDRQRKAFFASKSSSRSNITPQQSNISNRTAFSYRDGRNLGKFKSLKEVFNKFPSEKKAFERVMKFRRKTGIKVNNINEIKKEKRKMNINKRWDK